MSAAVEMLLSVAVLCVCVLAPASAITARSFPYRITESTNRTCSSAVGQVPGWLQGHFLRQSCGAFGNVAAGRRDPPVYPEHTFDCMGNMAEYSFKDSQVLFSNRYYKSRQYKLWQSYGFNFENSTISWFTAMSPINRQRLEADMQAGKFMDSYFMNPNVEFWPLGDVNTAREHVAVTEGMPPFSVSVPGLDSIGPLKFNDNFDQRYISDSSGLSNMPAHMAQDADGNIWQVLPYYNLTDKDRGIGTMDYMIMKIDVQRKVRQVINRYTVGNINLSLCGGTSATVYPDHAAMLGYLHSFVMTDNYLVIPGSSIGYDYCKMFLPAQPSASPTRVPNVPNYVYLPNKQATFIFFDKRVGQFVRTVNVPAMWPSHQANAYETVDGKLVMDMITYDYNIYESLYVDDLLNGFAQKRVDNRLERFTMDLTSWRMTRQLLLNNTEHPSVEFVQANHAYHRRPYQFAYMVGNVYQDSNYIMKVRTQEMLPVGQRVAARWPPSGAAAGLVGEPYFVQRPGALVEDDGVVLVGLSNEQLNYGQLAIINATTFTTIAIVNAPIQTPLGLHNWFFMAGSSATHLTPHLTSLTTLLSLCTALLTTLVTRH